MDHTHINKNKTLSVAHLNVRSLYTGFNEFQNLIIENNYDVVAVTETWLTNNIPSHTVNVNGYNFVRKDRNGSRGGGVAFYVKDHINFKVISLDIQNSNEIENLWIEINIGRFRLVLGVVYRVPSSNIDQSISTFDELLSHIVPINENIIMLGDVNINLFNLHNRLSICTESYGFKQIINEATRITDHTATLLDPIFVTENVIINSSGTVNADLISDHHLVYCKIKVPSYNFKSKFVTFRNFKFFDEEQFLIDLNNKPWNEIFYISDMEQKVIYFTNIILDLFDTHAPLSTVRVSKPHAPWMTDVVKRIAKERDSALRKYKQDKTTANWQHYKNLRNFTLASIRREKQAFICSSQNNSAQLWKTLKQMNIKSSKNETIPHSLDDVTEINKYFLSVFNKSNQCANTIQFYKGSRFNDVSFSFTMVDSHSVLKALNEIKSNACGIDKITPTMLKLCLPVVLPHLTHIVNCCMEKGYFPIYWKEAEIIPIPKVQNPSTLQDLRPISLLNVISKILEKVVFKQINAYFSDNDMLPKHQSGFRSSYSTTSALLNLTDNIITATDKQKASVLVALDFSKAFDTIDHDLLEAKLLYYGLDVPSLTFFHSYLNGRTQKVRIGNNSSSSKVVCSGVPQGSILGPLLFLIYTADMFKCVKNCHIQAYADDTQIVFNFDHSDILNASMLINSDLENIYNFSYNHNLKLNPSKSIMLLFCSEPKRDYLEQNLTIMIDKNKLTFSRVAKILGVSIDVKLRFAEHVSKLCQKCYVVLKNLYSNRMVLNFNIKKKLCETLIFSIISYCDIVYYPCLDSVTKNRLQKMQNWCCRFIFTLNKYDHITHKYIELKWLKLPELVKFHLLTFVHRLLISGKPSYLREKLIFRFTVHDCNIRNKNILTLPHHSTAIFQRSFTYNSVLCYNSLDSEFKSASSLSIFKKLVKLVLLQCYHNFIQ